MQDLDDKLTQLSSGYWLSRCLHVVADLGVADALGEAPMTAEELAGALHVHPVAFSRVMRVVAANGVFTLKDRRYSHNEMSRRMRSDAPQSMRPLVRFLGLPIQWAAIGELEHAVRTGRPSNEKIAPDGIFAYLAKHPKEAQIFNDAMTAKSHPDLIAVPKAYDFSRFGTIADIGGGRGHLLKAVLEGAPNASGVLFDLPRVIEAASEAASNRIRLQPGDFFKDDLPACDAYLLMSIIHDWSDGEATEVLGAVRRAAPGHAKLLVIEPVLPEIPEPTVAQMGDIAMLGMTTGRERTEREYADLFAAAGFKLERTIATGSAYSILEGSIAA